MNRRRSSAEGIGFYGSRDANIFLMSNVSACIQEFRYRKMGRANFIREASIMTRNFLLKLALLLASVALCALTLEAQIRIAGGISGTITDPTGAVVPNARVVLHDEGTGIARETVANVHGEFTFPDLNYGLYEISVIVQGFQKARIAHVKV